MLRIATLSTQRSGTKLFGSLFNTGTEVRSLGELFNPDNTQVFSFRSYLERVGFKHAIQLGSRCATERIFRFLFSNIRRHPF